MNIDRIVEQARDRDIDEHMAVADSVSPDQVRRILTPINDDLAELNADAQDGLINMADSRALVAAVTTAISALEDALALL